MGTLLGLGYFANAQDYQQEQDYDQGPRSEFVGISDERGKYNNNDLKVCGGVKLSDKMNNQPELNFHCKANKNKKDISTTCRVKCGGNGKGRNKNTPRKVYCIKSESYGAVKMIWGNPKAKPYDVKAFGCDAPSKYGSGGKDKSKNQYNGGDKDKNKYNGDKDKNKYPKPVTPKPYKPTQKPYQPPKPTYKPPKPTYKPTPKPYKPTQKPYKPTQKPYKPPTKKPYNPPKPTKKPYNPPKNPYNQPNKKY